MRLILGGSVRAGPEPPEHPLDAARRTAAIQVQRVGDVARGRPVGQHGEQGQVLGSTRCAAASISRASSGGSAAPPRETTRIASNSSSGAASLSTSPSADATRASSASSGAGSAV